MGDMADQNRSTEAVTSLQQLLRSRSGGPSPRKMTFYSLGNISEPTSVTYSDLYRLAQENSRILSSLASFQKRQPILLHLHDHWDVVLWFWSVTLAHGLPVLSTPFSNVDGHRQKHVQGLSTLLESPICITRSEYLPLFDGTGHGFELYTIESLLDLPRAVLSASSYDDSQVETKSAAMLMLTSGSTGNAKAVVLTHCQILASVAGKTAARALPPGRPFLNWIGLDHVGAFVEIHMHALWANEDQIHVPAADVVSSPTIFLDILSRHCVSRTFAPNFFLASLVSAASAAKQPTWDLSNLAFLVSGGEANDINTCTTASALLERYGAPRGVIAPGFGMTETCAGSIYNLDCPHYDLDHGYQVASLGKCINGMEMRVTTGQESKDGQVPTNFSGPVLAPANVAGDLEVRGDVVFQEYYRNPAATAAAFTSDGWFRTGDSAMLDSEGILRLVGRVQEVINIRGVKVATVDLQSSLEQAGKGCNMDRLIVFPSRAAHTEQVTVACLEQRSVAMTPRDMSEIEDRLGQACMMATGSRPAVFSLGSKSLHLLPTTTLGKISRSKMRSLFEDGAFEAEVSRWQDAVSAYRQSMNGKSDGLEGAQVSPSTKVELDLIEDFIRFSPGHSQAHETRPGTDTSLWALGYGSMDMVRLKNAVDARLGLSIPIITFMKSPTAGSLAAAISRLWSNTNSHSVAESGNSTLALLHGPGDDGTGNQSYDPVVAFQESGSKTPLWLVHPGVGEVLVFAGLAQHWSDDDRPLYALRARGFEPGETHFSTIEEAVDTYTAAIKRVQPQGPYALAGYSYGAMLAFEMAKRLDGPSGPGGEVRFLGSFNLPPHIKMRMRQLNWNMCLLHLAYFLRLVGEDEFDQLQHEQDFPALERETAVAHVLGIADKERMQELSLDEPDLLRWANVAYGLQSMAVDYEPTGEVGSMHVFHAEPLKVVAASREEWLQNHLSKWADFCQSEPVFSRVGGAHYTMLGVDHVADFAQTLKAGLKARGL